jgi:hypothetical protein
MEEKPRRVRARPGLDVASGYSGESMSPSSQLVHPAEGLWASDSWPALSCIC